jgi:hypothetical protein
MRDTEMLAEPQPGVHLAYARARARGAVSDAQRQLIAYSYQSFTAGRYPAANGYVFGAGLVAPSYGS